MCICALQNAWKWFIYNRAQNLNRSTTPSDDPPAKRRKVELAKHLYPSIPSCADDDESNRRNVELLKVECLKPKPSCDVLKTLITRTYPFRRASIIDFDYSTVTDILKDYPALKRCSCVSF